MSAKMTAYAVRRASAHDHDAIVALVRSERLNPTGLDWGNFWIVLRGDQVVGAVQVRPHPDGSREVGSFVVAPGHRGSRLGAQLLDRLVEAEGGALYAITAATLASYFEPWGFRRRRLLATPGPVATNFLLGQLFGPIASLLRGWRPRRMVILHRPPAHSDA